MVYIPEESVGRLSAPPEFRQQLRNLSLPTKIMKQRKVMSSSSCFKTTERNRGRKNFMPYDVPPPSFGTYDFPNLFALSETLKQKNLVKVPFASKVSIQVSNPAIQTVARFPCRTRCTENTFEINEHEQYIYKRRGTIESYQPRLSQVNCRPTNTASRASRRAAATYPNLLLTLLHCVYQSESIPSRFVPQEP